MFQVVLTVTQKWVGLAGVRRCACVARGCLYGLGRTWPAIQVLLHQAERALQWEVVVGICIPLQLRLSLPCYFVFLRCGLSAVA